MTTIFDFLNIVGLVGWATVLGCLIVQWYEPLNTLLFALEGICVLEVTRIAVGQLPGNLTLGIVLHGISFTNLLYVLPSSKYWGGGEETVESSDNASNEGSNFLTMDTLAWLVLYSWAITEVTRYPMYILTNNPTARFVRLTVPLVTFPVGAFAEGYASHLTLAALFASVRWEAYPSAKAPTGRICFPSDTCSSVCKRSRIDDIGEKYTSIGSGCD